MVHSFESIGATVIIGISIFIGATLILDMFGDTIKQELRKKIPQGIKTDEGVT